MQAPAASEPRRRLLALLGALLCAASPSLTHAQPAAESRLPTDGVGRLIDDVAGEGDASSSEVNPALLSATKGFDLVVLGVRAVSDYARGEGFGVWGSIAPGLGFALGFGVQSLRPGLRAASDFDRAANPSLTKLSFAASFGDGDRAAVGVATHPILDGGQRVRAADLDVGVIARLTNFASLGARARFAPASLESDALPATISLLGEVAVRPFGRRYVELAAGVRHDFVERQFAGTRPEFDALGLLPRYRAALRWQGWGLLGQVEQVRVTELDPATLAPAVGVPEQRVWRGSVALETSWDFVSVRGGVRTGATNDPIDAFAVRGRVSTQRLGRATTVRPIGVERFELAGISDQRDLIAALERLERAEAAGSRSVLLLDTRGVGLGWGALDELRAALVRVRNAGGRVFAYLESAGEGDYYLASAAEQVFIHPGGELRLLGLSTTSLYFKGALDRIGVRAEVIREREYKSAFDSLTRTGPSPEDEAQRRELLRDTYASLVRAIAQARGKTKTAVREFIDAAPATPSDALQAGYVDRITHRDEVLAAIADVVGTDVALLDQPDPRVSQPVWSDEPYVAVVLVEGTIIDGTSITIPFFGIRFVGGDTLAATLRELRDDRACKAIVLRIDSPGGSALASEVIWREVDRTRIAHDEDPGRSPPIVVSVADVAASGGYYAAMGAREVYALPNSVVGSIGVITLHLDVSGLLAKLGISAVTFKEGRDPDIDGPWRPYTPEQRAKVERSIAATYALFRSRVAAGRGLTDERVNEIGRGHVYSGEDGLAIGLVDKIGGLREAVAAARARAGIPERRPLALRVLPARQGLLDLILRTVDEPFPKATARARSRAEQRRLGAARAALPPALDQALARLPLSVLYLPANAAHALAEGLPIVE